MSRINAKGLSNELVLKVWIKTPFHSFEFMTNDWSNVLISNHVSNSSGTGGL